MSTLQNPLQDHPTFLAGYGQFPYVIVRVTTALYMQIPIHCNKGNDVVQYPGTHVQGLSEADLAEYSRSLQGPVHDKLIEHVRWMKNKIEADKGIEAQLCLVEGPETAYYFHLDQIKYSPQVPSGGTLVSQDFKMMGMNTLHYKV